MVNDPYIGRIYDWSGTHVVILRAVYYGNIEMAVYNKETTYELASMKNIKDKVIYKLRFIEREMTDITDIYNTPMYKVVMGL